MGLFFLYLLGIIALAVAVGAAFDAIGRARDAEKYPPPGRLVQARGSRLHAYETGERAGPTVVLDAALGGSCLSWALVQPEVAKFVRVCAYDRAGLGWSDAAKHRCTAHDCMEDLHALLHNAGLQAPYILVGHSFGGFVARLYAEKHRDEVAGLVLVDVPHPKKWKEMTPEEQHRVATGARLSRRGAWAIRLGIGRLIYWLAQRGALNAARSGVAAVSGGVMGGASSNRIIAPIDRLPAEVRPLLRTIWVQAKFFDSMANHIANMPETARQLDECGPLGDLPLVVLTASHPDAARVADQEAMANLSTRGKHIIAEHSGHWIPLDEPAVVVQAIRDVFDVASAK